MLLENKLLLDLQHGFLSSEENVLLYNITTLGGFSVVNYILFGDLKWNKALYDAVGMPHLWPWQIVRLLYTVWNVTQNLLNNV